MIQIYHNPRCGKSREVLEILEKSGKNFKIIKYLVDPPTREMIIDVLKKLNIPPIELIRQKEKIWIDFYKNKSLNNDEIIQAMVENPILIERPIVIKDNKAAIGRPPQKIIDLL